MESCGDCSKKVLTQDMGLHKDLLCPSQHTPLSLPKNQVKKPQTWQQRLVDESCGNDVKALLQKGKEWEVKYLQNLPRPGIYIQYSTQSQCLLSEYIYIYIL